MDPLANLEKFGRHVPDILMRQLLSKMVAEKFRNQDASIDDFQPTPSMERFHGCLLFLDIAGFTMLSQKLDVDSLRKFINAYFAKMIRIIQRYNGQIVKFAGDALFVIWTVDIASMTSEHADYQNALQNAVSCSLDINATCSNFKVDMHIARSPALRNKTKVMELITTEAQASSVRRSGSSTPNSGRMTPSETATSAPDFCLNVHAGISIGMMAGLDVGYNDRWEYLLLGLPLEEVAAAESEAAIGELVLSSNAHKVLHLDSILMSNNEFDGKRLKFTCGCCQAANGCFVVTTSSSNSIAVTESLVNSDDRLSSTSSSLFVYDRISADLSKVLPAFLPSEKLSSVARNLLRPINQATTDSNNSALVEEILRKLQPSFIDAFARHTHHAARGEYVVGQLQQQAATAALTPVLSNSRSRSNSNDLESSDEDKSLSLRQYSSRNSLSSSSVNKRASSLRDRYLIMREKAVDEAFLLADLREVVVLFINVSLSNQAIESLSHDGSDQSRDINKAFSAKLNFLPRNTAELQADQEVLTTFQSCFMTIMKVLDDHKGQLRQFIVDDKGTVCIATFGLRGSMTSDNISSSINAAHQIIISLDDIDITASIGVTVGKVYCGLVGGTNRHEYCIMGPSVNLAARLMHKASAGSIVCDEDIKTRDRTHHYKSLGEVRAKGYLHPLIIYKPLLTDDSSYSTKRNNIRASMTASALNLLRIASSLKSPVNIFEGSLASMKSPVTATTATALATKQIFGRQEAIFQFYEHLSSISYFSSKDLMSAIVPIGTAKGVFKIQEKPVLTLVTGPQSIGKSYFVDYITQTLRHTAASINDESVAAAGEWNIIIHSTSQQFRMTTQNISEPFRSWKGIIIHIAAHFLDVFNNTSKSKHEGSNHKMQLKASEDMKLLLALLPLDTQQLAPLLSTISSTFAYMENDTIKHLQGAVRLAKTTELIVALLQEYQKQVAVLVFIVIGQVDLMDASSLSLLQRVLLELHGFMFIATIPIHKHSSSSSTHCNYPALSALLANNSDRIMQLHLSEIDEKSTCELVNLYLDTAHASHAVRERIYQQTGGNPVFIVEMVKGFASFLQSNHKLPPSLLSPAEADAGIEKEVQVLDHFLSESHISRIESVVMYRFDQLSLECQLLIKAVSVECSNNGEASAVLLAEMLTAQDENQRGLLFSADTEPVVALTKICDLLSELLATDQFLELGGKRRSRESSTNSEATEMLDHSIATASSTTAAAAVTGDMQRRRSSLLDSIIGEEIIIIQEDDVLTRTNSFRRCSTTDAEAEELLTSLLVVTFKIEMEQRIVYASMLDEQKALFHSRIAAQIEDNSITSEAATAEALFQAAYHWEHAHIWPAAMSSYYRAGKLLDTPGAEVESRFQLLLAYQALNRLRESKGLDDNNDNEESLKLQDQLLQLQLINEVKSPLSNQPSPQCTGSSSFHSETTIKKLKKRAATSSNLHALQTDEQLLMSKFELFQLFGGDPELLEMGIMTVLKLAQACLTLDNDAMVTGMLYEEALAMITAAQTSTAASAVNTAGNELASFSLRDPSICFPVISGLIVLYQSKRLLDDEKMSKESRAANLFMSIAKSNVAYDFHLAIGLSFQRNIQHGLGLVDEGVELIAQARIVYSFEEHSQKIIAVYGSDCMPRVFAVNLQIILLRYGPDDKRVQAEFAYLGYDLLPKIDHLHSLAMVSLPLAVLFVAINRVDLAVEVFGLYMHNEAEKLALSHFKDVNPLLMNWMRFEQDQNNGFPELLMQRIITKQLLKPVTATTSPRSFAFVALDFFGISIEYVAARLLYLRTERLLQSDPDSAVVLLKLAMEYLDHLLAVLKDDPSFHFIVVHSLCLYSMILTRLSSLTSLLTHEHYVEQAKAKLVQVELIANASKYNWVAAKVSSCQQQMLLVNDADDKKASLFSSSFLI